MSSFTDNNLSKKLSELNGTQQSIQTLSLWLIHHRKHSKTIVQVWLKELKKASVPRRLINIYLANDVIQNSKKKGPEFTKDFGSVLTEAFVVGYKDAGDKQRKSLDRILSIWEERGVYNKEFIHKTRQAIGSNASTTTTTHSSTHHAPQEDKTPKKRRKEKEVPSQPQISVSEVFGDSSKKRRRKEEATEQKSLKQEVETLKPEDLGPVDTESMVRRLSALENSASCDAAIREKIAALPPEVSDISQLARLHDKDSARKLSNTVDNACVLLTDYNKRLSEELDERKNMAKMLRSFIITQTDQLDHAERRLVEYKTKLIKVKTVRQELKSHIQNLPDIGRLPELSGGLEPLPTINDLFH